jgi:hypothetical protein
MNSGKWSKDYYSCTYYIEEILHQEQNLQRVIYPFNSHREVVKAFLDLAFEELWLDFCEL